MIEVKSILGEAYSNKYEGCSVITETEPPIMMATDVVICCFFVPFFVVSQHPERT